MDEPIAIIGLDAKFPGDGDTAEKFYEFLLAGRSARTEVPADRYNADAFWHPDAERAGATRTRAAHFLKGSIKAFDAPFFSITPAEAASMDPQQRGMLECVYHALENAGIPLPRAAGTQTAVYIGSMYSDYDRMTSRDLSQVPTKYAALGTVASMLSNRISWFFDLRGPSVTIDTACSSSLVALHQACNALRLREASAAVVGGCNLMISPEFTLLLDACGVLGPNGKSRSFDSQAEGYARGEGFGALVLKRASDAVRDGDVIRAVIRGSGSNQDGRSSVGGGITQPSRVAQAELIRSVYRRAGVDPGQTRFFEAHGTGTKVGDPIEAGAIADVFAPHFLRSSEGEEGKERAVKGGRQRRRRRLYVGALKSNVGHLEGAAGVAAVIKGVMVLEKGIIPGNCWFERKNEKILDEWMLEFPTEPTPWPEEGTGTEGGAVRRMSINSFGVGGSNAHVVMDDARSFLRGFVGGAGKHRTVDVALGAFAAAALARAPEVAASDSSAGGAEFTPSTSTSDGGSRRSNGSGSPGDASASSPITRDDDDSERHSVSGDQSPVAALPQIFLLSVFDQDGIARLSGQLGGYLEASTSGSHAINTDKDRPDTDRDQQQLAINDLSYTLACKRTRHTWRSFCIAGSSVGLQTAFANDLGSLIGRTTRAVAQPRLAFVFTGQGAQWPAMGRGLMAAYPVFRESLFAADGYLNELGCLWSLTYELCKDPQTSRISEAEFSQPLCTALQVALVDLFASWNIYPHAVVGHSSGEIAAAYAARHISRESAWRIAFLRGKLSARLAAAARSSPSSNQGSMAAVGLDFAKTTDAIRRVNDDSGMLAAGGGAGAGGTLEIACLNSSDSQTVSGDAAKIDRLVEMLKGEGVFVRKLNVELAYHSRHMRPVAEEYRRLMGEIMPPPSPSQPSSASQASAAAVEFFSSLEGTVLNMEGAGTRLRDPEYWVDNLVSPVKFHPAVSEMVARSTPGATLITDMLEIGPHGALRGPLRSIAAQAGAGHRVRYESVLKRGDQGAAATVTTALEAVGALVCRGFDVDLVAVNRSSYASLVEESPSSELREPMMLTDLPGYPFNHSREYWAESRQSREHRLRSVARHELLGAPVPGFCGGSGGGGERVWRNYIRASEIPWVEDHRVDGEALYPAAGMLVMAVEASRQAAAADSERIVKGFTFRDVAFHTALRVPTGDEDDEAVARGVESRFHLREARGDAAVGDETGWREFQLLTAVGAEETGWREHCRGLVRVELGDDNDNGDGDESTSAAATADGAAAKLRQRRFELALRDARTNCTKKVHAGKAYRAFGCVGLDFGPTFRTLTDLHLGTDGKVLAETMSLAPEIRKATPGQYLHPHLVHPSTLDAVLQASLAPLILPGYGHHKRGGGTGPVVPVYAKEFWISAAVVPGGGAFGDDDGHGYTVAGQASFRGGLLGRQTEADATFTAVHPDTGLAAASATGLVFKRIPGGQGHGATTTQNESESLGLADRPAFGLEWKPDPTMLSEEEAHRAFGLQPQLLEEEGDAAGEDAASGGALASKAMQDCEALCLAYVRHFLGNVLSVEDEAKMGWHHKRYVAWMRHVVDRCVGSGGEPEESSSTAVAADDLARLEDAVKAAGTPEGKLITAVGRALSGMLVSGSVDPLDVIFGGGVAEDVYRHGLGSRRCYAQLCAYVDALAHRDPNMRILEVGGGTGGATVPVLETLAGDDSDGGRRFGHYDFTDISPSFFEKARETFATGDRVRNHISFKVLNIERDPVGEQGFEEGGYDLVLAANVLHATKSMDVTLRHVRRLLKPGTGKLVVFELTNPEVLLGGFCFGVLPGWWLSEDQDRSEWGPLMTVDGWRECLQRTGFRGLDAVFHDFPGKNERTSSVLVSTAGGGGVEETPTAGALEFDPHQNGMATKAAESKGPSTYILLDKLSRTQEDVSQKLKASFAQRQGTVGRVKMLHFSRSTCEGLEAEDPEQLENSTCIVLTELDDPVIIGMHHGMLLNLKAAVRRCGTLVWLSRGGEGVAASPETELVTGLARTVRAERPGLRFVTISFATGYGGGAGAADAIARRALRILDRVGDVAGGGVEENSFRVDEAGLVYVPRLVEAPSLSKHLGLVGSIEGHHSQSLSSSSSVLEELAFGAGAGTGVDALELRIDTSSNDLETLSVRFVEDSSCEASLGDHEVEFVVKACGLGHGDLAVAQAERALGSSADQSPCHAVIGLGAAGVVRRVGVAAAADIAVGDNVFGLCPGGAVRTYARSHSGFLAKISDEEEAAGWAAVAASVTLAYFTAQGALFDMGNLGRPGDQILIHMRGLTDALGMAAFRLVKARRAAKIFVVTPETELDAVSNWLDKVEGLPRGHALSSDADPVFFEGNLKRLAGGRGVDVVLLDAAVADAMDRKTRLSLMRCIAPFGRFVECGTGGQTQLATAVLIPSTNVRIETFDPTSLILLDPERARHVFQHVSSFVVEDLRRFESRILPVSTEKLSSFRFSQVREALREIQQQAIQSGTPVLVESSDNDVVPVLQALPRLDASGDRAFDAKASYIIAGGLGGLGRSMARWMVSRGARNLILLSRSGPVRREAQELMAELKLVCDYVEAPACDVSDASALRRAIEASLVFMPPVKGCIQGSMVLQDKRFEDMSLEEWHDAVRPKAQGSINLHEVLATKATLDFFVLLSSTVGLMGSPGQSNYAAGGTFQDAFAHLLRQRQQITSKTGAAAPAPVVVSLDLPIILDVGFVAEKPELLAQLRAAGWAYIEEDEFHAVLDFYCFPTRNGEQKRPGSAQIAPRLWLPQDTADDSIDVSSAQAWVCDPLFSHLRSSRRDQDDKTSVDNKNNNNNNNNNNNKTQKEAKHAALLAAADSRPSAEGIVLDALLLKLARVLSVDVANLDAVRPLHAYGVDSLVAVGLRAWLAKELAADMSVFEMTDKPSIQGLAAAVTEKSRLVSKFS